MELRPGLRRSIIEVELTGTPFNWLSTTMVPTRRDQASLKDAVERKKAIGILQETSPVTYGTVVDYLNQKRIPTVGLVLVNTFEYESPCSSLKARVEC